MKPISPELVDQASYNTHCAYAIVRNYDHRKIGDVKTLHQYLQLALTAVVEMENIIQGTEAPDAKE